MATNAPEIVGSGHTKFGRLDARTLEDLMVEAAGEALSQAGVEPKDVDAIFVGHFNSGLVPDGFPSSLVHQLSPDFRFTPSTRFENACASGSAAVFGALSALKAGEAKTVLVVGAEKMTSRSTPEVTKALAGAGYQNDARETSHSFPQVFAIAAKGYEERYGSPMEAMARIASKNHINALSNPLAQMQRNMDFEACNTVSDKNPLIAPPLRLSDCSLISDGAAAIVITTDPAVGGDKRVGFRATAHINDFLPLSGRDFIAFEGPKKAIGAALDKAGVSLSDLSFAEVHDCFTIAELLIYEAMGLKPAGRGGEALADGIVYKDGKLPVNVSGGLKAKGHPIGATGVSMHVLSYRQLVGLGGDMQLPDAKLGLVFNMGGSGVANYASVLERR
ncbi:MAG: acetyl-CoA acetyltransferase [Rhizobiales bacterium 65-9]|nr:acetyl-CoA acetyltransferase [Hyphomicrobiales bacterium]OJY39582.1 MAG: acetyl-CoA acetyltransferase [Rhizobiales bacterium 65-9]